jgi:hypothetical protein
LPRPGCYDFAMSAKVQISQCFKVSCRSLYILLLLLATASQSYSQSAKPSLPDPVKFMNKFDIVWNVARAVLDEMGYATELADKKAGRIVSKPDEFITGALTSTEIDKVAVKRDTVSGAWLKARYTVEVLLEIVSNNQTLVTVRTKMEGLNRDLDKSEKWIPLESLGVYEKRVLGKMSMKLMGNEIPYDEKKGFWEKKPQPVDSRQPKPYRTMPPE